MGDEGYKFIEEKITHKNPIKYSDILKNLHL